MLIEKFISLRIKLKNSSIHGQLKYSLYTVGGNLYLNVEEFICNKSYNDKKSKITSINDFNKLLYTEGKKYKNLTDLDKCMSHLQSWSKEEMDYKFINAEFNEQTGFCFSYGNLMWFNLNDIILE